MKTFPGTRTVLGLMGFYILVWGTVSIWKWAGTNLSGFSRELVQWVLPACDMYAMCRFLFPALGWMSTTESVTLFWASTLFFWVPWVIARAIIVLLEIKSPYLIGLLYFLAFVEGSLLHLVWNRRAYRTHGVVILRDSSMRSAGSLENDTMNETQGRGER